MITVDRYNVKRENETDNREIKTLRSDPDYDKVTRTESLEGVVKKEFSFDIFFPYKDDNGTLKGFTNLGNDVHSRWNIGHTDRYMTWELWIHEIRHNWYPHDSEIKNRMFTRTGGGDSY